MYRALSDIDSQAIRRHNFYEVVDKYKEYGMKLKYKAFNRYKELIRCPVLEHKKKTFKNIFLLHPGERSSHHITDTTA